MSVYIDVWLECIIIISLAGHLRRMTGSSDPAGLYIRVLQGEYTVPHLRLAGVKHDGG